MRTSFTILLLFLFSFFTKAQKARQISLDLNRSFHGTGDMRGLGFLVEYGNYVGRKLELAAGVAANVHNDHYPLFIQTPSGRTADASYRMVTGGLQLQGLANFAPLRTSQHEFRIGAGPVLRYQSSSASGGYSITSPPAINYPEPVFSFRQVEDQNMVTVGYQAAVSYTYTFPGKLMIGAKASFQNDTNADVITQYGLRIGKRF